MGASQTLDKAIPKTLDKFSKFKIIKKKSYQKYFNKNGMWELEKITVSLANVIYSFN